MYRNFDSSFSNQFGPRQTRLTSKLIAKHNGDMGQNTVTAISFRCAQVIETEKSVGIVCIHWPQNMPKI